MIAGTGGKGLLLFDRIGNHRFLDEKKGMKHQNILDLVEDPLGRIWMCRLSTGMEAYDPKNDTIISYLLTENVSKSFGVLSLLCDTNKTLWLGGTKWLYKVNNIQSFYHFQNNIFDFTEKIQLSYHDTSGIRGIIESDKHLIVSTLNAIHLLVKVSAHHEQRKIFTLRFGIDILGKGASQNAMLLDSKGWLWVATNDGTLQIDLRNLVFDESQTFIKDIKIAAGGKDVETFLGTFICESDKRNIRVHLNASENSYLQNNLSFKVKLTSVKGEIFFDKLTLLKEGIHIPYLPVGSYQITILAFKNNLVSDIYRAELTMPPLLSENKYIWFFIFLLIISLSSAVFWYKLKLKQLSIDHETEMQSIVRQLDMAKVKSLSNFFNPHFINNTLHWVQSKYRKDADTATVIGRLADNIQKIYNNTGKGNYVHLLQTEMEIVLNYLKISKVRFGKKLNYSLPNSTQINELSQYYYIPTLMLQIHVENAVEKGISNIQDEGNLTIDIVENVNGLCITISDNGKGRVILPNDLRSSRQSSTKVMEEMVSLFNQYNKSKLLVEYDDYYIPADTTHSSSYGTRVKLFIPKYFKYEL